MNKNINIPFIGIGIVVAIGLIWSTANFFNIRRGGVPQAGNKAAVEFDTTALEADQQDLAAADNEVSALSQDDAMFAEIDQASDGISGASDLSLDEKSLGDEAQAADISGDLKAFDDGTVQNEVDQSINDVFQN